MTDKPTVENWARQLLDSIPAHDSEELARFIKSRPEAKLAYPEPEMVIAGHWFCIRRYREVMLDSSFLEIHIGNARNDNQHIGYARIDPNWIPPGRHEGRYWELTRAYVRPRYRTKNYSRFMTELTLTLGRRNRARSVVAYPRHVAMLVTLLKYGFRTMEGNHDITLQRIFRQGRAWYGSNPNRRRLYYSEEFRPFIREGSFIMEKRIGRRFWDFLKRQR